MTEEKDITVEWHWIRPTKLCAIFDLFLAILAYIIALSCNKWVDDADAHMYYVSLYRQCYHIGKAHGLLEFACGTNAVSSNRGTPDQISSNTGPSTISCNLLTELEVKLNKVNAEHQGEEDNLHDDYFKCLGLDEELPWTGEKITKSSHHTVTSALTLLCLIGCILCFAGCIFTYIREKSSQPDDTNKRTYYFKIIGLVLIILFCLSLIAVIVFGVGFRSAVPYQATWRFTWGFCFLFAACLLTLFAGILLYFTTDWKKDVYHGHRTFHL